MKNFFRCFLTFVMLICLPLVSACSDSSSKDSPYLGLWTATTAKSDGLELNVETVLGGPWTFDLQSGGKVTMSAFGTTESGSWKETEDGFLVENEFHVVVSGEEGTLDYDDVLITFTHKGFAKAENTSESEKDSSTAAAPQAGDGWKLENGLFTCETFSMEVPEGWSIDGKLTDEETIRLFHTQDPENFDDFTEGSFKLTITPYEFSSADASDALEKTVENDKQFFADHNPEVAEAAFESYTGYELSGPSYAFKNCTMEYLIMDSWEEGTNDRSRLHGYLSYYSEEEKNAEYAMLESLKPLQTPDSGNETSSSAQPEEQPEEGPVVLETEGFTFTVPEGWEVDDQNSFSIKVTNPKFSKGYISVSYLTRTSSAEEWAEKWNENFGGSHEIWQRDYAGTTFYGITPVDTQDYAAANIQDGSVVQVKTMFINLDQAPEIMDNLILK